MQFQISKATATDLRGGSGPKGDFLKYSLNEVHFW